MKIRYTFNRKREAKLVADGYEFYGYEYDGDAQREQEKLLKRYKDVRLLREPTDTRGLKMYSIWAKDFYGWETE